MGKGSRCKGKGGGKEKRGHKGKDKGKAKGDSKSKAGGKGKGRAWLTDTGSLNDKHRRLARATSVCGCLEERGLVHLACQMVGCLICAGLLDNAVPINCVEFFAGVYAITRGCRNLGWSAFPYDINFDAVGQDLCSDVGFLHALFLVLAAENYVHLSPVCSTWVWMCRAITERAIWRPLGRRSLACVAQANLMVSRCCLLIRVCHVRCLLWTLEQPTPSVCEYYAFTFNQSIS